MSRFKDKTFLITGGARGLGAAQARRLVAEGGQVLIADVLEEQGQALASELGARCVFQLLDVTQPQEWQQAVHAAERLGPLSGLVNNAGVYRPLPLDQVTLEEFERHVRVNQTGVFLGLQAVAPALERHGGGSIVNMTKAAALELVGKGIRVNSVHPGPIDTDMLLVRTPEDNHKRTQQVPMKRLGTADEVAGLVLFLLSDEASYMTGSELAIDGGCAL